MSEWTLSLGTDIGLLSILLPLSAKNSSGKNNKMVLAATLGTNQWLHIGQDPAVSEFCCIYLSNVLSDDDFTFLLVLIGVMPLIYWYVQLIDERW